MSGPVRAAGVEADPLPPGPEVLPAAAERRGEEQQ